MLKSLVAVVLQVVLLSSALASSKAADLYLADAPPLTLWKGTQGHGIVGDISLAAMARAGYSAQLQMVPWRRAQREVAAGKNLLVIPLSRTPEREAQYTWIAPIIPMERAFFSLDAPVADVAEALKRYRQIAVGAGTAQEEILRALGFTDDQIYPLRLGDQPLRMLELGRVDAWFTSVYEGRYEWPASDVARIRAKLHQSPVIASVDAYLACSLACDETLVHDLRNAVQSLRADGTLQQIYRRYIPAPPRKQPSRPR